MIPSACSSAEDLLHFTLDGLLPPTQTLVVNPTMRTASLLSVSHTEPAHLIAQKSFSPNGMCLLVPLLQSYPHYCTYEMLLEELYLIPFEQAHAMLEHNWELAIRPIRRAIGNLSIGLRSFGLRIRNIRGAGYLIEPVTHRQR